jgi:pyrimidine deaminase RibD-like protein
MSAEISPTRLTELMHLAVRMASESVAEDDRGHPKVGAVLVDRHGQILLQSHRGESPGAHAEFLLLEKARTRHIDLQDCILFATLEPCTQRSSGKIPCAERIVAAGLAGVYIGTLDPNPNITGRGELYLSYAMDVGRFPMDLTRELMSMNEAFFAQYRDAHVPAVSMYASRGPDVNMTFPKPRLSNDRNQLLQQTLDLVSGDAGDVWVRGGDLSWWREAQITFLGARLEGRKVRIVARPPDSADPAYREVRDAALALGVRVVEKPREDTPVVKGTMVSPGTISAAMVVIDERSRSLLRSPDDRGLLSVLFRDLEAEIGDDTAFEGADADPILEELSESQLIDALHRYVPQYERASIEYLDVELASLRPLTCHLERFKLFRAARLDAMQIRRPDLGPGTRILGSPWSITPPVIERCPDGKLAIIDGTHRAYERHGRTLGTIRALVVDGVDVPLPAHPLGGWDEVRVYNTKLPRERRYDGYAPEGFRPIRSAFASLAKNPAD